MSRGPSNRHAKLQEPLSGPLIHRVMSSLFPKKNDYGNASFEELVPEMGRFGIRKRGQLVRLLKRHRKTLLQIDRQRLTPWEIRFFGEEFGQHFIKDAVRRQYFYALPALARTAMELEFGEAASVRDETSIPSPSVDLRTAARAQTP